MRTTPSFTEPLTKRFIDQILDDLQEKEYRPPISFRRYVDLVKPGYIWYPHCIKIAKALQRVANGEISFLLIFAPPRHGKSELISRLFPAYLLFCFPHQWVALASYGADLATTLAREARQNYLNSGRVLRKDSRAVRLWETGKGGGMWSSGVGGAMTGKGWHWGIIDDPVKNDVDAASPLVQERNRDWYRAAWRTRMEPRSAMVVIQTRWDEKDLAGFILSAEDDDSSNPQHWHIICLPAIKPDVDQTFPETCTVEPDHREPGEALCEDRFPRSRLDDIRKEMGSYFWSALYQQSPMPALGGGLFRKEDFRYTDSVPIGAKVYRYWDKAATEGGTGARTAGVSGTYIDGKLYIVDSRAERYDVAERDQLIRSTADQDGPWVEVWVEQEPGSGGKESVVNTKRLLHDRIVHADAVTGPKPTRWRPFAQEVRDGNVYLVRGSWNEEFVDELFRVADRPGVLKDVADATSGLFAKLAYRRRLIAV